jgi:hypothetical protein
MKGFYMKYIRILKAATLITLIGYGKLGAMNDDSLLLTTFHQYFLNDTNYNSWFQAKSDLANAPADKIESLLNKRTKLEMDLLNKLFANVNPSNDIASNINNLTLLKIYFSDLPTRMTDLTNKMNNATTPTKKKTITQEQDDLTKGAQDNATLLNNILTKVIDQLQTEATSYIQYIDQHLVPILDDGTKYKGTFFGTDTKAKSAAYQKALDDYYTFESDPSIKNLMALWYDESFKDAIETKLPDVKKKYSDTVLQMEDFLNPKK